MAPLTWNMVCTRPDRPVPTADTVATTNIPPSTSTKDEEFIKEVVVVRTTTLYFVPTNPADPTQLQPDITRTTTTFTVITNPAVTKIKEEDDGTKFLLFPKLPSELRIKIWKLALPGRRIITIKGTGLKPFDEDPYAPRIPHIRGYSGVRYQASQDAPPPALLFVNVESRTETLKSYHPLFTKVANKHGKHVVPYMNFELDILYIDGCHAAWVDYVDGIQFDLKRVKNLALGPRIKPWDNTRNYVRENDTRFKHFLSLKTLILHAEGTRPFSYAFNDDYVSNSIIKEEMEWIWGSKKGRSLRGVKGEVIARPTLMCALPKESLVDLDEVECARRLKAAEIDYLKGRAAVAKIAAMLAAATAADAANALSGGLAWY